MQSTSFTLLYTRTFTTCVASKQNCTPIPHHSPRFHLPRRIVCLPPCSMSSQLPSTRKDMTPTYFPVVCDRLTKRPRKPSTLGSLRHLHASSDFGQMIGQLPQTMSGMESTPAETYCPSKVPISSLISAKPTPLSPAAVQGELPRMSDFLLGSKLITDSSHQRNDITNRFGIHPQTVPNASSNMATEPKVDFVDRINMSSSLGAQRARKSVLGRSGRESRLENSSSTAPLKQKVIPCPYEFCEKTFSRNSNLKGMSN